VTIFHKLGVTVTASSPLWRTTDGYTEDLSGQVQSYNHVLAALGGYWSCTFTIAADRVIADDWIERGLGRHIEIRDDVLDIIWEGFVNRLTISYGPLAVVVGPLLNVANRIRLVYSTIYTDPDTGEQVIGDRIATADTNDTDSQDLYSIIPKVLSSGGVEAAEADYIRDTFLAERAWPKVTKDVTGSAQQTVITCECLGYVHFLNFPYNSAATGTQNANVKISAILADTPNIAWLVFGTTGIDANTLQVQAYEDDDAIALNVIRSIVAKGDASANRWLFGVFANREVHYCAAPTAIEYIQRLTSEGTQYETFDGSGTVYPWNIEAGKWLLFPDFLIGRTPMTNPNEDVRSMFIEQVTYTAPWQVQLKGGTTDRLAQILGRLGLAGVGA